MDVAGLRATLPLWLLVLSVLLFLSGYFPAPSLEEGRRSSPEDVPPAWRRRRVGQLVIVVIDALRADFVLDDDDDDEGGGAGGREKTVPKIDYLRRRIENGEAAGMAARASLPTVTLPRCGVGADQIK